MRFDKPAAPAFLPQILWPTLQPCVWDSLSGAGKGGSEQDPRQEAFPQQLLQQILPHLEIKIACVPSSPGSCVCPCLPCPQHPDLG